MRRSRPPSRSACRPSRTPAGDSASAPQGIEKARQILWKRRVQFQRLPGKRMREFQFPGVQEHAPQALLRQDLRSEEHTSELQSPDHLVSRLLLEKKKHKINITQL